MKDNKITAYVWHGKDIKNGTYYDFDMSAENIANFIMCHADMNCIIAFDRNHSLGYDSSLGFTNGQDLDIYKQIEPLVSDMMMGNTMPHPVMVTYENDDGFKVTERDVPTQTLHGFVPAEETEETQDTQVKDIADDYIELSKQIDSFLFVFEKDTGKYADKSMNTLADLTLHDGEGTKNYLAKIAFKPQDNTEDNVCKAREYLDRIDELADKKYEFDNVSKALGPQLEKESTPVHSRQHERHHEHD